MLGSACDHAGKLLTELLVIAIERIRIRDRPGPSSVYWTMSATLLSTDRRTERSAPRISAVMPVVRVAILRRHEPRLTEAQTQQAFTAFENEWPSWKEIYRWAVAERARVNPNAVSIHPKEVVRLRHDGKTPMIDVPRLGVGGDFDLRNCAALCVDQFSSKIWTRVGPHGFTESFAIGELTTVLHRYHALAESCGEWFFRELFRIGDDALNRGIILDEGRLDVTTVGLQLEEELREDEVNDWFFDGDRPNFDNEDLCRFFAQAAHIDYDLREVESRENGAFWMSMPMAVRLRTGNLALRTALYLVRPFPKLVQVVGIGLDDSEAGDFANEIALKVSRVIANRV